MSDSTAKSFVSSLALFWNIMRMRRGPEDLPASTVLLVITIAAQTLLALAIAGVLPAVPVPEALKAAQDHSVAVMFIDLVTMLFWCWAILRLAGKPERFLQTMTAVFGCQLVLVPVLVPAVWLVEYYGKESDLAALGMFILVAALVWGLIALARVLQSATGWPRVFCALLVIVQGLVGQLLAVAVFPDLLKAGA